MLVREQEFDSPITLGQGELVARFKAAAAAHTPNGASAVRFAVTGSRKEHCRCELGIIASEDAEPLPAMPDLFELRERMLQDQTTFNAVMIVPTGIGAAVGGQVEPRLAEAAPRRREDPGRDLDTVVEQGDEQAATDGARRTGRVPDLDRHLEEVVVEGHEHAEVAEE